MYLDLEIEHFRSIQKTHIVLKRGLNILVGPNGSGKTNLLCALKFLRDVLEYGAALAMGRAGGPLRNYSRGKREIVFRSLSKYGDCLLDRKWVPFFFEWEIRIAQGGTDKMPTITLERFLIKAETFPDQFVQVLDARLDRSTIANPKIYFNLIEESRLGRDFFQQLNNRPYPYKKSIIFELAKKGFSEVLASARKETDTSFLQSLVTIHPSVFRLVEQLKSLDEYNIQPDAARKPTDQVPEPNMGNDGTGISEVIHVLKSKQFRKLIPSRFYHYHQRRPYVKFGGSSIHVSYAIERGRTLRLEKPSIQVLDKITAHLSAAVNSLDSLDTEVDPTTGRRYVIFRSKKDKFYPEEVSDGTIKWLCLLTGIFLPYSKTFLLEEPENFMHPWMQQRLIEIMREQSQASDIIFILATHSATILNSSLPEEVVLVQRKKLGTYIERIEDMAAIQSFLHKSNFGLGDLWVSGGIGAVPSGEE